MSSTRPRSRTSRSWAASVVRRRPLSPRGRLVRGLDAPYWRRYAGVAVGTVGWAVQRRCIRLRHDAFCISRLTERRLLEEGFRGVTPSSPACTPAPSRPRPPRVSIPSSSSPGATSRRSGCRCSSAALPLHGATCPTCDSSCYGDGPESAAAEDEAERLDVRGAVAFRGRRPQKEVERRLRTGRRASRRASEREGYGLIVVEAAARGTPSVVVAGAENAAVELVADGVNGAVAEGSTPESIGTAIVKVVRGGPALRESTIAWFVENADGLRIERSIELVTRAYAGGNR